MPEEIIIEWNPPVPRKGILGEWDRFIGPSATRLENGLILIPAILAGVAVPVYAILAGLGWNTTQLIIAGLLALDLVGGVVANATSAAKRWYHRSGQGFQQLFRFTAIHFLQPLVIALLFRQDGAAYFLVVYGYLLIAGLIILKVPLYIQRPSALLFYLGGLLIVMLLFAPSPGLEWFIPVFYLKLLVSHLVLEAPFGTANVNPASIG